MCQTHDREADRRQHPPGLYEAKGVQPNPALRGRSRRKGSRQAPVNPQTPGTGKATEDRPAGDRREHLYPLWPLGETVPLQHRAGGERTPQERPPTPPHSPRTWGPDRRGAEAGAGTRSAAPLPLPRLAPPPGPPFPSSAAKLGLKDRNSPGKRKLGISIGPLP